MIGRAVGSDRSCVEAWEEIQHAFVCACVGLRGFGLVLPDEMAAYLSALYWPRPGWALLDSETATVGPALRCAWLGYLLFVLLFDSVCKGARLSML